ncbi:C6 finger domain protein [Aspergillus bombycis]|uniref:C6 finger domain protein n=1 Tax=Aspergillus bombycis TaxID=109264 RepID=A0A1F8A8C0_9EURO|nr:C6 finger domain protein [Aspergillus bombycis]OGM47947.1 C6 finger domain protein [Aspergillus bombycis]
MTSAIPNSHSSSSPQGNPQGEGDSSNCEKRSGPRLAHRKSRTGCQRCRARRVKRDLCVATVIVMGSPVFMTGPRKKERPPLNLDPISPMRAQSIRFQS